MTRNLNEKQRRIIKIISIVGWIPILIDRISFSSTRPWIINAKVNEKFSWIDLYYNVIQAISVNHFYLATLLYLIFVFTFYYFCMNAMNAMNQHKTRFCPKSILKLTIDINNKMKGINVMASMPFLVICPHLLIAFSGFVSFVMDKSSLMTSNLLIILSLITLLASTTCLIITVLPVITLQRNLKDQVNRLRREIFDSLMTNNNMTIEWKISLKRLSDPKLFEFSVLSLFLIEFNMLLCFSSTILTFSILFIKMENS